MEKKNSTQINLKRHFLSLLVVSSAFCVSGCSFIENLFNKKTVDYSQLSETELEDDTTIIMTKYDACDVNSDLTNTFKPYEMALVSLENVKRAESVYSVTKGSVTAVVGKAPVVQSVRSANIKTNGEYFMENISKSSMVSTARRFYQSGDVVKTIKGTSVTTEAAKWSENNASELNKVEHEQQWGKDLSRPSIYIISSKTVDEDSVETNENGYKVSLKLNNVYSVLRYVRQMTTISDVKNPVFNSINLTFNLSRDLKLTTLEVNENYSVDMIVTADTTANIQENYYYGLDKTIPNLTTNINYNEVL